MKIINAVWEKRNIGCDAYEITLDNKDLKDFETTLKQIREQNFSNSYVVIKMPVGNLRALHALEDEGFRFMEVSCHVEKNIKDFSVSPFYKRMMDAINFMEINKNEEWDNIVDNYLTEDMFISDRIYLDDSLPKGISTIRYKNWSKDLKNNPNTKMVCFISKKTKQKLGFAIFGVNKEQGIYESILGGTFPNKEIIGIGGAVLCCHYEYVKQNNGKKFETHISSNNLQIMKFYTIFGNVIIDEQYVLRKIYN